MRGPENEWHPSRRAQAAEWWARQVMRFVVGPLVIGWELIVDDGHNLAILLVGAMLAASMDVRSLVRELIRQARQEQLSLKDLEERTRDENGG